MLFSFTSMFTELHVLTVHLFGKQIQLFREHVMLLIEKVFLQKILKSFLLLLSLTDYT